MFDGYGRKINYMRISVTDLCNLRCVYCMPEKGLPKKEHKDIISIEETVEIAKAAVSLGIDKIRVTGGEPLVKSGIVGLCARISAIEGLKELSITTNGVLLKDYAKPLKLAGVSRVNISLDTLVPERYAKITRIGKLSDVLEGIEAARAVGLSPIKINVVLVGGFNDDEIEDFVEMTRYEEVELRFIELMPIGESARFPKEAFISGDTVLERVPELEPLAQNGGVARLYRLPGGKGRVGLISPISRHFCGSCNRIRLTADGKLKPCLHSSEEISLKGLSGQALRDRIAEAIMAKPCRHELENGARSKALRSMNQIGG